MTYFMNYSPEDWPPPPDPAPAHRRWRLRHRYLLWTLVYVVIAAGGLVAVHFTHATPFDPNRPWPASGTATPDRTETHR